MDKQALKNSIKMEILIPSTLRVLSTTQLFNKRIRALTESTSRILKHFLKQVVLMLEKANWHRGLSHHIQPVEAHTNNLEIHSKPIYQLITLSMLDIFLLRVKLKVNKLKKDLMKIIMSIGNHRRENLEEQRQSPFYPKHQEYQSQMTHINRIKELNQAMLKRE